MKRTISIPERWKFDHDGGFNIDRMNDRIREWQDVLGMGHWEIQFSPLPPLKDSRASIDIDIHHLRGAFRIDSHVPASQVDRLIVHELLHALQAPMEDCLVRALSEHGESAQAFLRGSWERAQEFVNERLTSLITGTEIEHFDSGDEGEPWLSAFPVPG